MFYIDDGKIFYCSRNKLITYELPHDFADKLIEDGTKTGDFITIETRPGEVNKENTDISKNEAIKDTSLSGLSGLFESQEKSTCQIFDTVNSASFKKISENDYDSDITAITKVGSKLAVGTFSGDLYFDNNKIASLGLAITSLSSDQSYFLLGTDSGVIQLYENGHIIYKHTHTSPINQVYFSANKEIYVHDKMSRLVIIKPNLSGNNKKDSKGREIFTEEKNQYDNLEKPFVFYKHLFIADKKVLYAKTKNNFSSLINLKEEIIDFCFSETGGILFILEKFTIKVIDFYSYKMIREIDIRTDENGKISFYNNVIFFTNERLNAIPNVLNRNELFHEPRRIVFEENKHIIRINPELPESDDQVADYAVELFNKQPKAPTRVVYSDDESDAVETAIPQPPSRQTTTRYQVSDDYNLDDLHSDDLPIPPTNARARVFDIGPRETNILDFSSDEDYVSEKEPKAVFKPQIKPGVTFYGDVNQPGTISQTQPFKSYIIAEGNIKLLRYNDIGFILLKKGSVALFEFIFHDSMRSSFTINCKNHSRIADFSDHGAVLCSDEHISLYEESYKKWTKTITQLLSENLPTTTVLSNLKKSDDKDAQKHIGIVPKAVRITNLIYLLLSDHTNDTLLVLYKSGKVKNIFDIPSVNMFEVQNDIFCFLQKSQLTIHKKDDIKTLSLNGPVNFLHIEENQIYYGNSQYLYKMTNNMSERIFKIEKRCILTIIKNNIVILNNLLPVPDVEFLRIETSQDEQEESLLKNETQTAEPILQFDHLPKKVRKFNPFD
ncbi:hypothetical protein M153_317000710 [Pseudoloma neurophilia]|uniref:Uncharacterized protein n=1 Tax=Pseudoloma neurophilia TaxID=146866 RepID=A0A0R0M417_9MICR|nr:hypothetical protein M153_317000710 [Pseudoloma neurophilia]